MHILKKYLKPLVDNGLMEEAWNCTDNLLPSQEWDPVIRKSFEEAEIIFFLISSDFYDTPYIVEHEIKNAIDRQVEGKLDRNS